MYKPLTPTTCKERSACCRLISPAIRPLTLPSVKVASGTNWWSSGLSLVTNCSEIITSNGWAVLVILCIATSSIPSTYIWWDACRARLCKPVELIRISLTRNSSVCSLANFVSLVKSKNNSPADKLPAAVSWFVSWDSLILPILIVSIWLDKLAVKYWLLCSFALKVAW